jgi:hypothetical protein
MDNSRLLTVVSAFTLALLATTVQAALIVPAGLNNGDAYHVIFVSSTVRDATSTNIADYDTHVQAAAEAAGIGSTAGVNWLAVGSTETVDAINHISPLFTDPNTVPIYNQNGQLVASSLNDLANSATLLSNPILYDEYGVPLDTSVWTGTFQNGLVKYTNFWLGRLIGTSPLQFVEYGTSNSITAAWVNNGGSNRTNAFSLYGISQEIIVGAVPVPAAVWLFGSGLLGLIGVARRKKAA